MRRRDRLARPCRSVCVGTGVCPYADPAMLADVPGGECGAVLACLREVYAGEWKPGAAEDDIYQPRNPEQGELFT